MALNVYEGLFILDSGRFSRDPDNVSGQLTKLVQEAGGEILVSRLWEERRLAYPIEGQRKGVYWLTYFKLDSLKLAELNRQCGLFEANLRNLFIRIDDRIVDVMVEHALAGPTVPSAQAAAVEENSDEADDIEADDEE